SRGCNPAEPRGVDLQCLYCCPHGDRFRAIPCSSAFAFGERLSPSGGQPADRRAAAAPADAQAAPDRSGSLDADAAGERGRRLEALSGANTYAPRLRSEECVSNLCRVSEKRMAGTHQSTPIVWTT